MGKNKIGRNDPCPCGSGKKYKNCCMILGEEPTADLFTRCSQMISSVKLKLDDACKGNIKRICKDTRQSFLYFTINKQMTEEQESFFSDWLWFDRRDEEDRTFAVAYLAEHQQYMPQLQRECLQSLSDSYLSVYEPTHIGDNYLELKDIFSQSLHQVTLKERLEADLNERPLLLMGRLVGFSEGKVFSGMVLAADNSDGQADFLKRHINYLASVKNESDIQHLLKNNPEILFGLFDHTLRKKLININDIRYLHLNDGDQRQAMSKWLESVPGIKFAHKQSDLEWYQDEQAGMSKMVALAEDYVITCSSCLDDLYDWEILPEGGIKPPREWTLVNSNFHRQPPPPQLAAIWFAVLREQETERWLHTSHRELDDKSPLEVLEENNTGKVLDMLDKFAAQLGEDDEGLVLVAYMRERVESLAG
jgi:hypothetical protein